MIVCQVCGYQNDDDDSFCGGCPAYLPHSGVHVDDDQPVVVEQEGDAPEPQGGGLIQRVKEMVGADGTDQAAAPTGGVLLEDGPAAGEVTEANAAAQQAEAEARAREEEAHQRREAERRAEEEAAAAAAARRKAREEAAAAAAVREEAERKAREEADAQAKAEAEERERQAQAERREAERLAREKEEADQRAAAERKALAEAEAAAAAEVEAAERARLDAEVSARREAEERARLEAEEQAKAQAEARRRAEEAERRRAEEQQRDEEEAQQRAAEEAEAKRKEEEEARRRAEEEERALREAEQRAAQERLAREKAEREAAEAAERARRAAAMVAKPPPAKPKAGGKKLQSTSAAAAAATTQDGPAAVAGAQAPSAMKPTVSRTPPPRPTTKTAPTRKAEPGDLICGQCGEPNKPDRKFCRRCATSLTEAQVSKRKWWQVFKRSKKVVAAGERPGHAGRSGSKGSAGRRAARGGRSVMRWGMALVLIAVVVLGVLGSLGIGPGRSFLRDGLSGLTQRVRDIVSPSYEPANPEGVRASAETNAHPAGHAADGFDNTHWSAGVPVGQEPSLRMNFPRPVDLARVLIHSGASGDAFRAQARPRRIRLVYSDGSRDELELQDVPEVQEFSISATRARRARLVVLSVHPGTRTDAPAITEIEFFTKR